MSSVLGIAALLIALTVRLLITFVSVLRAGFNLKEKVFIALAWMPKATVQVKLPSITNRPSILLLFYCLYPAPIPSVSLDKSELNDK